MRALLVEDDETAAQGIGLILKSKNIICNLANTGEEALELARHYDYDIILLDVLLPDIDGYEVIRRLRAGRIETPVMILSGLGQPEAKVKALGLGADEFLTKPFNKAELLARIQAIVRRSNGYSQPTLRVGAVRLNLASREVRVGNTELRLTGKERAVLELLFLRKGTLLRKETFIDHLYGGIDEPATKIVDVFIHKLRKKLTAAGADGLISTMWGRGYMVREPDGMPQLKVVAGSDVAAVA